MTSIRVKPHLGAIERPRAGVDSRLQSLRLDKNERMGGYSRELLDSVLKSISAETLNVYPEPEPIYRRLAAEHNLPIESFLLTHGADGAIRTTFEICDWSRGNEVVCLDPTFAMVGVYCDIFNVQPVLIGYEFRGNALPALDVEAMIRAISPSTSLVILANPNSPTGTLIEQPDLERVIAAAGEVGALVLIDETYYDFSGFTMASRVAAHDNLLIARSLSKGMGLAGLRIGYLIAAGSAARAAFALKPMYEVNNVALQFALALMDRSEEIESYAAAIKGSQSSLSDYCRARGIGFLPTGANFCYIHTGARTEAILQLCQERRILIRAGMGIRGYEQWLRVSLVPEEELKPFFDALEGAGD
ncbi:MAG: histidinol-phosphate aminotransferase family protein [Leptospiraceae bacterium]|nr:histidinol-phosphate aminotransferase family protein [Leptospiraceae bacterium]